MIRLTRLLIAALTVFLLGLSADNAFAQQEQTRAAKGDTVRRSGHQIVQMRRWSNLKIKLALLRYLLQKGG